MTKTLKGKGVILAHSVRVRPTARISRGQDFEAATSLHLQSESREWQMLAPKPLAFSTYAVQDSSQNCGHAQWTCLPMSVNTLKIISQHAQRSMAEGILDSVKLTARTVTTSHTESLHIASLIIVFLWHDMSHIYFKL